jgi:hypothetical protein
MARIRRCRAPAGTRPEVLNGYMREFTYAYGAVLAHVASPSERTPDWMLCQKMNTQYMAEFLSQVGKAHADEFVVMILNSAVKREHMHKKWRAGGEVSPGQSQLRRS